MVEILKGQNKGSWVSRKTRRYSSPTFDGACNHGVPRKKMKPHGVNDEIWTSLLQVKVILVFNHNIIKKFAFVWLEHWFIMIIKMLFGWLWSYSFLWFIFRFFVNPLFPLSILWELFRLASWSIALQCLILTCSWPGSDLSHVLLVDPSTLISRLNLLMLRDG